MLRLFSFPSLLLNKNNINYLSINKDLKKKIKKLDLLISFENNEFIQSKIFTMPKYGCWLINHGISNNIFTGFWECFLGLGVSRVIIQKMNKNNLQSKINIIDEGFYSTKTISWFLNRDFIFEKSSVLIAKNLKLLHKKYFVNSKNFIDYNERQSPNFITLIIYIIKKYPAAIFRVICTFVFNMGKNKKLTALNYI